VGSDKSSVSNRQTLKKPKEVLLEEAVLRWYLQQRSSGVDLKAAAEIFAKHYKLQNFNCSSGWLWRFRHRHNISNRKVCGEVMSGYAESVEPFRQKLNDIIQSGLWYPQIYNNSGEMGSFWRGQTENTQASPTEQSTPEGEKNKERLSDLLSANADGTCQLELTAGNPGVKQLKEEDFAADVVRDSAMKEESDNELQEFAIRKKLLSSAISGIDAVITYVDSSTDKKLQEYYEHLRTVREILIEEQQQMSVQTKCDSFLKPALLCSKTSKTSESSIDE
jgi:hypothetical protein